MQESVKKTHAAGIPDKAPDLVIKEAIHEETEEHEAAKKRSESSHRDVEDDLIDEDSE